MNTLKLNLKWSLILMILLTSFASCSKHNDHTGRVEANGLTKEINDLVPAEILKQIENLGMPINRGGNPPKDITGYYLVAPHICVATNIPNDNLGPGYRFADMYLKLSDQNNEKLTVKVAESQTSYAGTGTGAYMVGENKAFTVFCIMKNTTIANHDFTSVDIFSGTIETGGIKNFYFSSFMIEGGGAQWILVEDGQGRVAYDEDGMSDRVTETKSQSLNNGDFSGKRIFDL